MQFFPNILALNNAKRQYPLTLQVSRYCLLEFPANTRHWHNSVLMLCHRLRRWPSIKTTLVSCLLELRHCTACWVCGLSFDWTTGLVTETCLRAWSICSAADITALTWHILTSADQSPPLILAGASLNRVAKSAWPRGWTVSAFLVGLWSARRGLASGATARSPQTRAELYHGDCARGG